MSARVNALAPSSALRLAPAVATPRLSILAVDDDPLILMNMVDMLEDLGHAVVPAASGREALDQLKRLKFDLLVTDHAMPQMTGLQLIRETRARFPDMAVVLATGYAELPSAATAGVVRLPKPYSQADLAEAVSKAGPALPRDRAERTVSASR